MGTRHWWDWARHLCQCIKNLCDTWAFDFWFVFVRILCICWVSTIKCVLHCRIPYDFEVILFVLEVSTVWSTFVVFALLNFLLFLLDLDIETWRWEAVIYVKYLVNAVFKSRYGQIRCKTTVLENQKCLTSKKRKEKKKSTVRSWKFSNMIFTKFEHSALWYFFRPR